MNRKEAKVQSQHPGFNEAAFVAAPEELTSGLQPAGIRPGRFELSKPTFTMFVKGQNGIGCHTHPPEGTVTYY